MKDCSLILLYFTVIFFTSISIDLSITFYINQSLFLKAKGDVL